MKRRFALMYKTERQQPRIFLALVALFVLSACDGSGPVTPQATSTPAVHSQDDQTSPSAPASTPQRTPTPSQKLSSPSPSPFPSPTFTPSLTPTPPYPLTIAYLRLQAYPPGEIVVEEWLENGPNYFQQIVSYQSEGLKLRALLTIPFGATPAKGWPVIIFNHGFIPPDVYRTTERYVAYVAAFASNGYIVLRPDYRGHDQSEGEARGAYGSPDYTIDVLNALAAMKAFPQADPDRIGMWGHSMGGYITLRAMVTDPDIRAGVIWAGVVGPYPNLFNREEFSIDATPLPSGRGRWRVELFEQFGTLEENPDFWASLSANSYLEDLSGPIQLHHGTADESVPFSVSELLYNQLVDAGRTVEFYGYPGDDHNIAASFSLAMQRSIQFFDSYVKGDSP